MSRIWLTLPLALTGIVSLQLRLSTPSHCSRSSRVYAALRHYPLTHMRSWSLGDGWCHDSGLVLVFSSFINGRCCQCHHTGHYLHRCGRNDFDDHKSNRRAFASNIDREFDSYLHECRRGRGYCHGDGMSRPGRPKCIHPHTNRVAYLAASLIRRISFAPTQRQVEWRTEQWTEPRRTSLEETIHMYFSRERGY